MEGLQEETPEAQSQKVQEAATRQEWKKRSQLQVDGRKACPHAESLLRPEQSLEADREEARFGAPPVIEAQHGGAQHQPRICIEKQNQNKKYKYGYDTIRKQPHLSTDVASLESLPSPM